MNPSLPRRELLAATGGLAAALIAPAAGVATEDRPANQEKKMRLINATEGNYSQAVEISGFKKLVLVSGQVGEDKTGNVPASFREQALLAWSNVAAQLREAQMTVADIVKMTVFLSDRKYRGEAYETRHQFLGEHCPAMTIIICGIYREEWLLEIEVIAAA